MVFSERLSVAFTVNCRPAPMSWVSPTVLLNVIVGGVRSRWTPPGFRAVSQAHTAAEATVRAASTRRRSAARIVAPVLVGGRCREVVHDVWRDQDDEIAPQLGL